jgi:hypothetical protein
LAKINITLRSITFIIINPNRLYVKSLYKRYLTNALNWYIRRDLWRNKAIEIRADFERNRWVWLSILDDVTRMLGIYEERLSKSSMESRVVMKEGVGSCTKHQTAGTRVEDQVYNRERGVGRYVLYETAHIFSAASDSSNLHISRRTEGDTGPR